MKIVLTPHFIRAAKKLIKKTPSLQKKIEKTIELMENDVFNPSLITHKLSGDLDDLWACSCGYDYRIVFSFEKDPGSKSNMLLLVDIGTHDEIY